MIKLEPLPNSRKAPINKRETTKIITVVNIHIDNNKIKIIEDTNQSKDGKTNPLENSLCTISTDSSKTSK
jgi:hypothetical protein